MVLAFEAIDGTEPAQPWHRADLHRVATAVAQLAQAVTPSPIALPREHPRLGGWADLARDAARLPRLPAHSAWAARHLSLLIALEEEGLESAQGLSLVHFDMYPHNILLTPERVLFVDWPHARLGAPFIDLLMLLSSGAATGIDPEPILREQPLAAEIGPRALDGVLAAHAGFCLAGELRPATPGLEAIVEAKLSVGRGAITWLERRLKAPRRYQPTASTPGIRQTRSPDPTEPAIDDLARIKYSQNT